MPKYNVYIDQVVQFITVVEADNEEQAEEQAGANREAWTEYNRLDAEIRDDLTERNSERRKRK